MADIDTPKSSAEQCDTARREALRKLGTYGAVTGVGLLGLMTATKAPAASFAEDTHSSDTKRLA
ncbi:hypothetical protein [Flavisphingomonas formosensis]|uniref:hypothetical protein n=1 Tax=Flavisphingomonas formosensis TaxID=861534 RepID=UPI0012FC6C5F|nr:hypothetical protein [Sphingomonas formosensis]